VPYDSESESPITRALAAAAKAYSLEPADLLGRVKLARIVDARRAFIFGLHRCGHANTDIGRLLARDHSTIGHHIAVAEAMIRRDPTLSYAVSMVVKALGRPDLAIVEGESIRTRIREHAATAERLRGFILELEEQVVLMQRQSEVLLQTVELYERAEQQTAAVR
jgi:hypothetical protein